jgi:hypothetical protein
MEVLKWNSEDYSERNVKDRDDFRTYNKVKQSLRKFEISCTLKLFQILFEEHGDRLWNHFTQDCNRGLEKFITYLTDEQYTTLLYNAYKNENMYYPQ